MKYIEITDHYYNDETTLYKKNEANRITYLGRRSGITSKPIKVIGGTKFNIALDVFA